MAKNAFRLPLLPLLMGYVLLMSVVSCDDDTAFIGTDLMPGYDNVTTSQASYRITSRSVRVDSVLANTNECSLGAIIDPETRALTTGSFMAQFYILENTALPNLSKMMTDDSGRVVADSCDVRIYFDSYYGDSLSTMKLVVSELDTARVLSETADYYTNIDPSAFVNPSPSATTALTYAVKDLTRADSLTDGSTYFRSVVVRLGADYGSFILRKYYENPAFFKNSYNFIHHVCPGFYFKTSGGVGSMIYPEVSTLNVYFRYHTTNAAGNDTLLNGMQRMASTKEVLQQSVVENRIPSEMLDPTASSTYVKAPTGIFTRLTLPVGDIVAGDHYTDSINSARFVLRAVGEVNTGREALAAPSEVVLVRTSEVESFFRSECLPDSRTSFIAEYAQNTRSYVFPNVSALITVMKRERDEGAGVLPGDSEAQRNAKYAVWEQTHPDWNSMTLIPVTATYTTTTNAYGYTSKTLTTLRHCMRPASVQLDGGAAGRISLDVIYSRFAR